MKICTQCKYYKPVTNMGNTNLRESPTTWHPQCLHPNNASVIDGKPHYDLQQLRYGIGSMELNYSCRREGDWWEAKQ